MINLKKSVRHVQWNIIAGVVLLFFALFILIASNNNSSHAESSSANDSEATTGFSENEESSMEDITVEETDNEKTTDNETTVSETTAEETTTQNPKKLINFDAEHPYMIRVNRAENFAVIYGMDKDGRHTIPYKAFVCSTGLEEDSTPLGVFEISDKYRWRLMVDGTYAQYAVRIYGQIMLHSVPYLEPSCDTLESWEYNKLGEPASLGCVRFRAADIKWIYTNCNEGTTVNIYSEPGEESPIPLPEIKKIKKSNPKSGWDPTDPEEGNPWKQKTTKKKKDAGN